MSQVRKKNKLFDFRMLGILLCASMAFFYSDVKGQTALDSFTKKQEHKVALYLTFDDGPCEGSDQVNLISLIDSIKINVFIIGSRVFLNDTLKQYYLSYKHNPFVEIGNHSFTHANGKYRRYYEDPSLVMNDFLMNEDSLNLKNKISRLPGRNTWRLKKRGRDDYAGGAAAADSLATKNYFVFGWDIEWLYDEELDERDAASAMEKKIEEMVWEKKSFTSWNIIILCHDYLLTNKHNRLSLQLFIQKIKEKENYSFEHLSNYPK